MGETECFRANVAFSLYGVLSGKEDLGCDKRTFINSFFTTTGVETFTQALYNAGVTFQSNSNAENDYPGGVSSQCSSQDGNNNNNGDDAVSHNQKYGSGYTSYGLGCYKSAFAMKQFKGPFCNGQDEVKITDKLTNFNSDMTQASCVPIYGGSSGGDGNDNKNNNGLDVLYYSTACSVREFPGACPDPYGKLAGYARADAQAVAKAAHPRRERLKMIFSWILLALGILLILFSLHVWFRRARRSRRKRTQDDGSKRKWFVRSKPSSSKVASDTQTTDSASVNPCKRLFGFRRFKCFGRNNQGS